MLKYFRNDRTDSYSPEVIVFIHDSSEQLYSVEYHKDLLKMHNIA